MTRERIGAGESVYRIRAALPVAETACQSRRRQWTAAVTPSLRRSERRDRHGPHGSQIRAGSEASDGGNVGGFAAAQCLRFVDRGGFSWAAISMDCAVNGAPIWAAKRPPWPGCGRRPDMDYFAGLDISLTLGVRTRVLIPAASAVSVRRGVFRLRVGLAGSSRGRQVLTALTPRRREQELLSSFRAYRRLPRSIP